MGDSRARSMRVQITPQKMAMKTACQTRRPTMPQFRSPTVATT